MGAIGGGIWHGVKGARNSPRVGASERAAVISEHFINAFAHSRRVSG